MNSFIDLTQEQIETLSNAMTKISNSDVIAINGIISLINSAETLVNDKRFKFSSKHISNFSLFINFNFLLLLLFCFVIVVPDSLEAQSTDGLSDFIAGNQGIVDGIQSILDMGQATVMGQQKNPLCKQSTNNFNFLIYL